MKMHILDCPDSTCPHQAEQARVTETMERLADYYEKAGRDLLAVTIRYALKTGITPDEQSYVSMMSDLSREIRFTQTSLIETVSHGKLLHADGTEVALPYRANAGEVLYMTVPGIEPTPARVITGNFGPAQPMPRVSIVAETGHSEDFHTIKDLTVPDSDFYGG